MNVLHIQSSILGYHSVSRQISAEVVARLRAGGAAVELVERDLVADPLPHLELATLPSRHPAAAQVGEAAKAARAAERAESDRVLQQFLDADVVVVGAPMYNFTVPSQLKAWIDRVVVPGATFRYGENGPEGLAGDKRVVLVPARGNFYGEGSPNAAFEHLESYLRTVFGFIGVTDLEVVAAEGLSRGADARASAVERATAAARELRAA